METMLQDLRFATRMLLKSPAFTVVAVLTLALGIGANTAIFALLDPLLLRKLPVSHPEGLVFIHSAGSLMTEDVMDLPAFHQFRDHNAVFSGICAFTSNSSDGVRVSGDYFSVLGVRPGVGRLLLPDDERGPAGAPVVVLSAGYWRRVFASDPKMIGRVIRVHGKPYTVVGVTPPEFFGAVVGESPDLYLPLGQIPAGNRWVSVLARLKPGVSRIAAQIALDPLFQQIAEQSDLPPVERRQAMAWLVLTPASRGISPLRDRFSLPALILMAVVGFILLIACSNVASLLLARGFARMREITVRMALGAGRRRLVGQLLTESALLTTMGAAAGLLTGRWASGLLVAALGTERDPIVLSAGLTSRVALFTAAILAACVVLCGLAPALAATRTDLGARLRTQRSGLSGAFTRSPLGRGLVVAQVALSVTLLVGAGLLLHSLANLETVDVGFDRDNVLIVPFHGSGNDYTPAEVESFYRQLFQRVESLPGVRSASFSAAPPMGDKEFGVNAAPEGVTPAPGADTHVFFNSVTPGYFETMRIPLLAGRDFNARDDANSPRVAVINQTMARHYFGGQNPLGKRFRIMENNRLAEVVGVVADSKYKDLRERTPDFFYMNWGQGRSRVSILGAIHLRVERKAAVLLAAPVHDLIPLLNSSVSVGRVKTLREQIDISLHADRMVSALCTAFAILALALTCVGLYGTLSTGVTQRTNEIGVRMALGARPTDVVAMIVREGLALTLTGLAAGIVVAFALTSAAAKLLFGITPADPVTLLVVPFLVAATAAAICYLPARRASRLDPMVALRDD